MAFILVHSKAFIFVNLELKEHPTDGSRYFPVTRFVSFHDLQIPGMVPKVLACVLYMFAFVKLSICMFC